KEQHQATDRVANKVFDMVGKFVGYGFCRSHAAAFAHTVYQTAYLKAHHTACYMAAVLEHKPGFYPVHTVLEEARLCGVQVLPVDVCVSGVKYQVENGMIRVPLTQVKQVSAEIAEIIVTQRSLKAFQDLDDIYRRVPLAIDGWESLARAGALRAFGERRDVLWQLGLLARRLGESGQEQLSFEQSIFPQEIAPLLQKLGVEAQTAWDFATQNLTTGPHPIALHRAYLNRLGTRSVRELLTLPPTDRVKLAGVVIARQQPPTANGMAFLVLEDETGRLPVAIAPPTYGKYPEALRAPGLLVEGRLEGAGPGQTGSYRSVLIQRLWSLSSLASANSLWREPSHWREPSNDSGRCYQRLGTPQALKPLERRMEIPRFQLDTYKAAVIM
ncbi:MAG: hypothetical protein JOZ57_11405, partial [Abitibacteriaceae bacterium]|nr:hypothetical protein [Abditibacteriaceae bacterium]